MLTSRGNELAEELIALSGGNREIPNASVSTMGVRLQKSFQVGKTSN
ncbi:hypothetical protein SBA2_820005 [Acidobacteriia bacterium SbA2]|nr:hypothetical protein SBA2_820005 [Acidobacteriia bacterium SbA2]